MNRPQQQLDQHPATANRRYQICAHTHKSTTRHYSHSSFSSKHFSPAAAAMMVVRCESGVHHQQKIQSRRVKSTQIGESQDKRVKREPVGRKKRKEKEKVLGAVCLPNCLPYCFLSSLFSYHTRETIIWLVRSCARKLVEFQ